MRSGSIKAQCVPKTYRVPRLVGRLAAGTPGWDGWDVKVLLLPLSAAGSWDARRSCPRRAKLQCRTHSSGGGIVIWQVSGSGIQFSRTHQA
jgi:hypothetical protein